MHTKYSKKRNVGHWKVDNYVFQFVFRYKLKSVIYINLPVTHMAEKQC